MEEVIGSLRPVSGHTYDTVFELIFTTERVIIFLIQSPSDTPARIGILELFVMGNWRNKYSERLEKKQIADERIRNLQKKSLDELISSHRLNQALRYDDITSVEIKRGMFDASLRLRASTPSNGDYKVKFTIEKKQVPEAQRLLELVLKEKIKGKDPA